MSTDPRPLALIIGVGEATGRAACEQLSGTYRLAMVARTTATITRLATTLDGARAFPCDVIERDHWIATLRQIKQEMGTPTRILVNTEGGGWGDYQEISVERFAASFEVNVVALLVLVQTLFPERETISGDTRIVISSSPAAYTSEPIFLGLAPARAAQRVLAETLDTMLSPSNLRFAILSIAGAIDEPAMRAAYPTREDRFFIQPDAIAKAVAEQFDGEQFPARITVSAGDS